MESLTSTEDETTCKEEIPPIPPPIPLLRSYSITCDEDILRLSQNLCPRYALHWRMKSHIPHWPEGTNLQLIVNDTAITNPNPPPETELTQTMTTPHED